MINTRIKKLAACTLLTGIVACQSMGYAQQSEDLEARVAVLEKALAEHQDKKNGLHISNNLRFAGLVQMDANLFDGVYNTDAEGANASDIFVRRVHIRLFHKLNDDLDYVLLLLADDDNTEFLVGFIRYQLGNNTEFRLGKIKEDRSFSVAYIGEELTGERPMVTNAFATAFQWGAQVHRLFDNGLRVSFGAFKDRKFNTERDGLDENNSLLLSYNTRLTWSKAREDWLIHLGASYGLRDVAGDGLSINMRGDVWKSNTPLAQSGTLLSVDHADILMSEFVVQKGAFRFESEYGSLQAESLDASQDDASYSGYYFGVHYFLDGRTQQSYDSKNARFRRPTNENNVWEVYARYSSLDLVGNNMGTKANVAMLGATYFLNPNLHFQVQVYDAEVSGPGLSNAPFTLQDGRVLDQGNAIAARASYRF
ncbi:porin [Agaribacter flavus]|uniref:Porin n=1 Tax=Agaribacter flavus TaxID=1902781 RepID=A0ABV7FUH2_9ALTE